MSSSSRHERIGILLSVWLVRHRAALSLVALITVVMTLGASSSHKQQSAPTPLQLFQKLLPVVRHPRCVNCHGGIDPRTPAHKGMKEVLDGSDCDPCHDAQDVDKRNDDWALPGRDHFFVGKTDEQLCALYAEFAMKQGHARFMSNHIDGDTLIGAAFVGVMGGARSPGIGTPPDPPADPPPMSRAAFSQLAKDWLNLGQGACELLGRITLDETVSSVDTFTLGPVDYRIEQNGTRTATIELRNGQYQSNITYALTQTRTGITHMAGPHGPCTLTSIQKDSYTGDGSGTARVTIKDTLFFADTKPPQTDYRIDVKLPPEKSQKTENNTVTTDCGFPIPQPTNAAPSFDWDSTMFVIEGHVEDPNTDGRAGACDKMVKHSDVGSTKVEFDLNKPCFRFRDIGNSWYPGLMERHVETAFHDNSEIPFHIAVRWNLRFK